MGQIEQSQRNRLSLLETQFQQQVGATNWANRELVKAQSEAVKLRTKLSRAEGSLWEIREHLEEYILGGRSDESCLKFACEEAGLDVEELKRKLAERLA